MPGAAVQMASLLADGMQTATWLSAGMGEGVFPSRLARTRATNALGRTCRNGGGH
jgi:hypothetical protein